MLSGRRSRKAIGYLLLATGLLGVALFGGREIVLFVWPSASVDVSNLDGTVQVFVECEQAGELNTGEAGVVDLGRLPADTPIYVSVTSFDRHPAWDIEVSSNGSEFFTSRRGYAKTPLTPPVDANAVVFAQQLTAGGNKFGATGCQRADVVSQREIPGYRLSSDDKKVPTAEAEESPYRARHFPYDQIDALGRWSLAVLAVLGAAAAVATRSTRQVVWSHGKLAGGIGGALGLLAAIVSFFGAETLRAVLAVYGILLLFATAIVLIRSADAGNSEGAAGGGGSQREEEDHAAADSRR